MMTYYDLIEKYGQSKDKTVMWNSTKRISDFIAPLEKTHKDEYWKMMKDTYAIMCGHHYNKEFAEWQIHQMFFVDKNGKRHDAPYWSWTDMQAVYEANKSKIKNSSYTCADFAVTLNMIKSDNYCMFMRWFNNDDTEVHNRIVEASINYLNDEDDPDGKIWDRFNR